MRFKLAIFLFILFYQTGFAGYISANVSYDFFASNEMSDLSARHAGMGYTVELGAHKKNMVYAFYYKKSSPEGKIRHDDTRHELEHDISNFGFKIGLIVSKNLYANFGAQLGFHKTSYPTASAYEQAGISKAYSLPLPSDKKSTSGFMYGLGYNFAKSRKSSYFVEYQGLSNTSGIKGSTHAVILGFRYKVKLDLR